MAAVEAESRKYSIAVCVGHPPLSFPSSAKCNLCAPKADPISVSGLWSISRLLQADLLHLQLGQRVGKRRALSENFSSIVMIFVSLAKAGLSFKEKYLRLIPYRRQEVYI